jgi:hypothetical protein
MQQLWCDGTGCVPSALDASFGTSPEDYDGNAEKFLYKNFNRPHIAAQPSQPPSLYVTHANARRRTAAEHTHPGGAGWSRLRANADSDCAESMP